MAAANFVPSVTAVVHWHIFHLHLQWRILAVPSPGWFWFGTSCPAGCVPHLPDLPEIASTL